MRAGGTVSTINLRDRDRRSSVRRASTQYLMKYSHLNHLNREPSETCFLLQATVDPCYSAALASNAAITVIIALAQGRRVTAIDQEPNA